MHSVSFKSEELKIIVLSSGTVGSYKSYRTSKTGHWSNFSLLKCWIHFEEENQTLRLYLKGELEIQSLGFSWNLPSSSMQVSQKVIEQKQKELPWAVEPCTTAAQQQSHPWGRQPSQRKWMCRWRKGAIRSLHLFFFFFPWLLLSCETVTKINFLEDIFNSFILQLQSDILQWSIIFYCLEICCFTFLPRSNVIH